MRRALLLIAAMCALLPAAATADPIETGQEPDCTELAPIALDLDTSTPVELHVRVLLDGVDEAVARKQLAAAERAYAPLNITLTFEYAQLPAVGSVDPADVLKAARAAEGGRRPAGIDLVYVLTKKDLASPLTGNGVAGQSDCIGGIAWADRGFAAGELDLTEPSPTFGWFYDTTAKIAAHELGHLLGAQHHYANCAEAPATDEDRSGCTLMSNDVGLAELRFSTINGAIVRAHAEQWAGRTPTALYEPPPPPQPNQPPPPHSDPGPPASGPSPSSPAPQQAPPAPRQGARSTAPPVAPACRAARMMLRVRNRALRATSRSHAARHLRRLRVERVRRASRAVARACR